MDPSPSDPDGLQSIGTRNRFDRMEWAGAFGDLGTLIPFVFDYIAVLKIDPFEILFSFGAALPICGIYYKTPFPVQPMKAIGAVAATQAAQTAVITQRAAERRSEVCPCATAPPENDGDRREWSPRVLNLLLQKLFRTDWQ
jgi:Molybdate transporter of MFS superfamily